MRAQSAAPRVRPLGNGRIIKGTQQVYHRAHQEAPLSALAAKINREHAAAFEAARSAVQRARRAGELLLQARDQCAHGTWLPWLTMHCPDITERTAQAYMRLARHCLADPTRAEQLEALTLRAALAELAAPKPEPMPEPKSATVADLPRPAFDPRTAAAQMREIDAEINRRAHSVAADVNYAASGLQSTELRALRKYLRSNPPGAMRRASAQLELRPGSVTMGYIGKCPRLVIFESRRFPGFWYDLEVHEDATREVTRACRPCRELGMLWRVSTDAKLIGATWKLAPDDGKWVGYCGEVPS